MIFYNHLLNREYVKFSFSRKDKLADQKGYDVKLAHGFVTINIRHQPKIEKNLNIKEKAEQFLANGPVLVDKCKQLKNEKKKEAQLKYIDIVNNQYQSPLRK